MKIPSYGIGGGSHLVFASPSPHKWIQNVKIIARMSFSPQDYLPLIVNFQLLVQKLEMDILSGAYLGFDP